MWLPSGSSAIHQVFISWNLPLNFFKINFDGNVMGNEGGADFIIKSPNSRFVDAGGSHLFGTSILSTELRVTWAGIVHARLILYIDHFMIEGDSSTVIHWIQCYERDGATHRLL